MRYFDFEYNSDPQQLYAGQYWSSNIYFGPSGVEEYQAAFG